MSIFKESKSFEDRKKESEYMKEKYPDRIPIIVERSRNMVIFQISIKKIFSSKRYYSWAIYVYYS